jgi:hypothetical protein
LGEDRTRVARTRDEIEVRVGLARTGRELFPALILAMALILAAEGLLANKFYLGADTGAPAGRGRVTLEPERNDGSHGSHSTKEPLVATAASGSRA